MTFGSIHHFKTESERPFINRRKRVQGLRPFDYKVIE